MITPSTPGTSRGEGERQRVQLARHGLVLFFSLLVPLSALSEGLIIVTRDMRWTALLMWMPGLAALLTRLILHEGMADISFRFWPQEQYLPESLALVSPSLLATRPMGQLKRIVHLAPGQWKGLKAIIIALLFPTIIGLLAYGIAWITGLAQFSFPTRATSLSTSLHFALHLLVLSTIMTIPSALTAAGEELGWRGYMLTRLIDARIPCPVLLSGVIWGLWHLPLILTGLYFTSSHRVFTASIFMLVLIAFGFIIARLRLESESIWPAITVHASWNVIIPRGFDYATRGVHATLWTGEAGVLVALIMLLAAFIFS
ncbi:CPBP family intramembrane metalloprotease [Ktedonosporobacter rubrisoli]|uniref:CPBP family intramembrane metalloprotease n=1 Tax=Ktedonosporobacter rubrisoli TaxID=2509675 RepID=A0A4P6JI27_KTERU|nr:CPBP family intramembrane glutamic endopeptidase [Ktedonosporobacter rubrisoli]QBD74705.1 CPBP family intramembrane metalloprotease [Ktedonosporobacter rubrisoli]